MSRLVDRAVSGESFVIAKAGRPLVKGMPIDAPDPGAERRVGFLSGLATLPEDFDRLGASEIEALFGHHD